LADAASKALKSESVKREEVAKEKKKRKEGAVGDIGPAILTNYGVEEAKNSRQWLLGLVAVVAVVLVVGLLFGMSSDRSHALKAFTEPDPTWRPPSRIQSQQERAWLADRALPIILNLDEATIGANRTISLAPLRQVFGDAGLKDHVLLSEQKLWVPAKARDNALEALRSLPPNTTAIQGLQAKGIVAYPFDSIADSLSQNGMPERDAALVMHLLSGQTSFDGENWIRDRFAEGLIPESLEIAYFNGREGRRLKLVGQNKYGSDEGITYRGRLMRMNGWTGAQGNKDLSRWHLLDVQVASRSGSFPEGRGW
ncbi:MAG: hypothetical protein PF961_14765, partial [Planctomycetota bacterium]|nr:hypothetical protein [Planctomycetota bacterium]